MAYIEYISGRITEEELLTKLAIEGARRFAYDRQLPLFPDERIERARVETRKKFDAGESIDVTIIQKEF